MRGQAAALVSDTPIKYDRTVGWVSLHYPIVKRCGWLLSDGDGVVLRIGYHGVGGEFHLARLIRHIFLVKDKGLMHQLIGNLNRPLWKLLLIV